MENFLNELKNKAIIFDGAMGTSLQKYNLDQSDFKEHPGCNEWLNIAQPNIIKEIHASFLENGAQAVETNTFGANRIVLSDYDLQDKAYELNLKAAQLAKEVTASFSTKTQSCYVSGSIGPGTKLPSLNQIKSKTMIEAYKEQISGLIDGGADLLQIETCQDLLQMKLALVAADQAFKHKNRRIPVILQATMQKNGKMLLGTDLPTVIHTFADSITDVIGINCSTGPHDMREHIRTLSKYSPKPISILPNAGLPKNKNGKLIYDLTPREYVAELVDIVKENGANIVGGCCGTTPEHIRLLSESLSDYKPPTRRVKYKKALTSLYDYQEIKISPPPLLIGERSNTNGSRKFKRLLKNEEWEDMQEIAIKQANKGAHVIDVCLATVDRNEEKDVSKFIKMLNRSIQVPIMIDSTNLKAVETALMNFAGKTIINSTNLENGLKNAEEYIKLAKRYDSALVCLAIDEEGMAKTAAKKIEILERFIKLCKKQHFNLENIFFDCLTFSLATGDKDYRDSARESLAAIKTISDKYPEISTLMGISNVSFGLTKYSRKILNSVFLAECVKHGLSAAIVHAAKILPLHQISKDETNLCSDLIYNKNTKYDPLEEIIKHFAKNKKSTKSQIINLSSGEKLKRDLIDGRKKDITNQIDNLLQKKKPFEIINSILLPGMEKVGSLFSDGKLQLPFVLKSAEVMKYAVDYLEPFLENKNKKVKATVMLATVKGDVHDIGKNLVEIILSNNDYKVIDLGLKQTPQQVVNGLKLYMPDVLGLSALLIKSTIHMKETLKTIEENKLSIPVLCGGAALTNKFTQEELQNVCSRKVFYCDDAFAGLKALNNLSKENNIFKKAEKTVNKNEETKETITSIPHIRKDNPIPNPPFFGHSQIENIEHNKIYNWINKKYLFYSQWDLNPQEFNKKRDFYGKKLENLKNIAEEIIKPKFIYGYFPCAAKGNNLRIYKPETLQQDSHPQKMFTLKFNRNSRKPHLCLSDYFRNVNNPKMDVVAFQIVTIGKSALNKAAELKKNDKFQDYFLWYGYCAALTEALATFVHHKIRKELGINNFKSVAIEDEHKMRYQGRRYSFGYKCCPDLSQQRRVLKALAANRIGIKLNKANQLIPEFSTLAMIVHHPEARYW